MINILHLEAMYDKADIFHENLSICGLEGFGNTQDSDIHEVSILAEHVC